MYRAWGRKLSRDMHRARGARNTLLVSSRRDRLCGLMRGGIAGGAAAGEVLL